MCPCARHVRQASLTIVMTLTIQWIKEELVPILKPTANSEVLLALDAAAFHKTLKVKKKLKDENIVPALVSLGCISIF